MDIKIVDFSVQILDRSTSITNFNESKNGVLEFNPRLYSIFIPDLTVETYFGLVQKSKDAFFAKMVIEELLSSQDIIPKDAKLNSTQYITFYLLHEEGHLIHYKDKYVQNRRNHIDYLNDFYPSYYNWKSYVDINHNKTPESYYEMQKRYREIEFEKIADTNAINKIKNNKTIANIFINE